MKKLLKFLVNRIVIVGLLITAQLLVIAAAVTFFAEYFAVYYTFTTVLALFMVFRIINSRENPAYKIAWIILILLVPPFGTAVYYIFSGNKLSNVIRCKLGNMYTRAPLVFPEQSLTSDEMFDSIYAKRASDYVTNSSRFPAYSHTETTYFPNGETFFEKLIEMLETAEKFIFLEYFIISKGKMWDRIHEILIRKATKGVDVRIIYDDMGCIAYLDRKFRQQLEADGIKTQVFNRFIPILSARLNNRNHRKICVIDGNIGFTGGINIGDEYININSPYGYWKDNAVMLEGAGVWSLTVMFLSMWDSLKSPTITGSTDYREFMPTGSVKSSELGVVQPYTDNPLDDNPVGETIYLNMIYSATEYVWITTPYLIIDYNMEQALCSAAKKGIDVRIIVPGIPDKKIVYEATKSCYPTLLEAGVKIYEYSPGFVHAKTFLSDGKFATVGTVNLDFRSLYLHFECGVWMYSTPTIGDIKGDFDEMFGQSRKVIRSDCNINVFRRAFRSIIKLMSPLF